MLYFIMKFGMRRKVLVFVVLMYTLSTQSVMAAAAAGIYCAGAGPASGNPKVNTALGCIPVQMDAFIAWFVPALAGVSGGISFLLMIYGFILLAMSSRDPKAAQGAQETITSAITGLLISVFAIFLVRLIMLKILVLPGVN
jgi:hypothetical protein